MISKRKLHFLQLTIVFIMITIGTLLYNWQTKDGSKNMMSESMGNMMSSMNLKNVKLSDLIDNEKEENNISLKFEDGYIKDIHYLTTIIIVTLLPFIIAGSVFLAVLWIK